ncbi:MAG TPA: ABC transporter permease subunit [Acidimicrobiales bacterium]|nr:ABC transporter permease subunit [Acidimicrobiales bacterium]
MTWLAWRQFRAQAAVAAVVALAVTVALVVTHGHIAALADPGDASPGYQSLRLLGTALIGLPAFIGAFWGAPLLARELEAGTHRLAWTQSVTRGRWLAVKLGVAGAVAVVATGLCTLVLTWWSVPFDRVGNRIGTANFGQRGIAPVAYAVFALALGALIGVITRRTLPAMAATLAGFFVVRFGFQLFVRPHLAIPVWVSRPSSMFGPPEGPSAASGAWVLASRTADAAGHVVSSRTVDRAVSEACHLTRETSSADLAACVRRLGFHDLVRIHPADRFWALQGLEATVFLALAAVLAGACFWWVRHRTP